MSANEDYDKLSPEQRAEKDKADRAREAKEQAGELGSKTSRVPILTVSIRRTTIHLEARAT